ncbi:NADH-quinone oxidoreductase subunit NuoG [Defluviimonas sp. CAU 1641]|uniref:NADH-quinone oxidoreductase subunit NuoG n=2 Tax=Defluviimonas salinarum TaxID=2992147 RepID=A0ABT3J847_9RHOB|nr:NADH-quinone oxidoreductase subunit NuoG [Defluviimonas salinarum]
MPDVTINGQKLQVEPGTTILQAAESLGLAIPTFCYIKRLPPLASCRMCLVEIEGQRRLQPACATAVADGMVVRTESELIAETRSSMLDMLLANHPLDCPICDKGGECELQDMVMAYGPRESRFRDAKRVFHSKDIRLSPVIIMNVNRCVQCQRCVRVCEDVVGAVALGTVDKGMDTAVTGFEGSLASCDQCGNCVEVCPVGALMSFPYRYKSRPWDLVETDTVCPHCGTGCQLTVGTRKGEFKRIRSKWDAGLNGELLCARGRFGLDFVEAKDRVKRPMIRRDGELAPVSWDEAGAHLRRCLDAVRGKPSGGVASPRLPNEVLYQFQKLMRTAFRTNSMDCSSRWSTPVDALRPLLGEFLTRAPLDDLTRSDRVLVVGGNVTEENPVTDYLLRDAVRQGRTGLLMLSARPSRLEADARAVLRVEPGGEASGLAAVAAALVAEAAAGDAGRLAAELAAAARVSVLVSADVLRPPTAETTLRHLGHLLRRLAALDKGPAFQFLFDRANQLGAWDLGVLPDVLPGLGAVRDDAVRNRFAEAWHAPIPAESGHGLDGMLDLCAGGRMGAFYVVQSDILAAYPDRDLAARALGSAELLIVQDTFLSETAALAEIVLPAAGYGEEAGTFTNGEGRAQALGKFREPAFEARDNLAIFDFVAAQGDHPWRPQRTDEVRDEIARMVMAYDGLAGKPPAADGAFTSSDPVPEGAAELPALPPAELPRGGLLLVTGNGLFHNGYLSERSSILNTIAPDPYVELSAADAERLGFAEGDRLLVRSAAGEVAVALKINRRFPDGLVFIPENYRDLRLNSLLRRGEYPCPVEVIRAPVRSPVAPSV